MTVAEYTDVGLLLIHPPFCFRGQFPTLEQDVADSNHHSGEADHARPGEPVFFKFIDIARHGDDGSNPFELPNDLKIADITSMKDGYHAREMFNERRIEEPMRIGNDSDPHDALLDHGTATGRTPSAPCTSFH